MILRWWSDPTTTNNTLYDLDYDSDSVASLCKHLKKKDHEVVLGPDHHHPHPSQTVVLIPTRWPHFANTAKKKNPEVVVGSDHYHPTPFTNSEHDSNLVASLRKHFQKKSKSKIPHLGFRQHTLARFVLLGCSCGELLLSLLTSWDRN